MEAKVNRHPAPKVSIVVLNFNNIDDIIMSINSVLNITYPNYEIIVVDNASPDDDVIILKRIYGKKIEIIANDRNYGYSEGNNIGIRFALKKDAQYILLLNNDVTVDPAFLDELVKVAEKDLSIGVCGPQQFYFDNPGVQCSAGGRIYWYLGLHQELSLTRKGQRKYNMLREVDFVNGACMLIRREVIENVGMLPSEYFMRWEDIDYCMNVRSNGYKCMYVPESKIWHKVASTYKKTDRIYPVTERGFRNRIIFFRKYLSTARLPLFIFGFTFVSFPLFFLNYIVRYRDLKKAKCLISGIKQGFSYKFNKNQIL